MQGVGNVGQLGNLGAGLVNMIDKPNEYGVQSGFGAGLSGALKGAAAGSVVPGIGTLIGAGVGLIGGIFGNKQAKKAQAQAELTQANANTSRQKLDSEAILANYDNLGTGVETFKQGGTMKRLPFPYQNQLQYPDNLTPQPTMYSQGGVANTNFDVSLDKILGPSAPTNYWKGLAKTTESIGPQSFSKGFVNGGYMASVVGHSNPAPGVASLPKMVLSPSNTRAHIGINAPRGYQGFQMGG